MKRQFLAIAVLAASFNLAASEWASFATGGALVTAVRCELDARKIPADEAFPVSRAEQSARVTSYIAGAATPVFAYTQRPGCAAVSSTVSLLAACKRLSYAKQRQAASNAVIAAQQAADLKTNAEERLALRGENLRLKALEEELHVLRLENQTIRALLPRGAEHTEATAAAAAPAEEFLQVFVDPRLAAAADAASGVTFGGNPA